VGALRTKVLKTTDTRAAAMRRHFMARLVAQFWRLRPEDGVIATVTSITFTNTCVLKGSVMDDRKEYSKAL
jgi:hypothetical protein